MKRNAGRIDHVVALVWPANFDRTVAQMELALGVTFGPAFDRADLGVRVAVAFDAGLEIVTPLGGGDDHPMMQALAARGDHWSSVAFGVADLAAARQRLAEAGHEPVALISGLTGVEPYAGRIAASTLAIYDGAAFGGLQINLSDIDE